jgi:bacillithiol biosynthesis deacetylase BshB2
MKQHILVVLPHPDDESFGLSGTLAKHVKSGAQVTYACLTLGEMGRNMGIPPFANRVTLPQVRKKELEKSCKAIGIQDLRMLGFHDKTIEFEAPELLEGAIDDLLTEIQPSVVYTFYPGYSVHPDHDATGAAVVRCVEKLSADVRPEVHCIAFANNTEQGIGKPDIKVDVKDFLKAKVASIQAHRSQFQSVLGDKKHTDKELQARFGTEHFWTYRFA